MSRETYIIIDGKFICKSKDGELTDEYRQVQPQKRKSVYVKSDDLGVSGVFNHADGKRYDSKSSFEKAVKAKGCRIIGNDYNNSKWKTPLERGVRGDFNVAPALKQAVNKVVG